MRFVVLRYGASAEGPSGGTDLLDDLTAPGAAPPVTSAGVGPDLTDDAAITGALARIAAGSRSLRDDLATLAAVLGVTTVLDEQLGSPDVATTVRSRAQGLTLTDGRAATPDGPLVGLHVLDAPDLDALVDVLTLLPAGTFEVHPVVAA